MAYLFFWRPFVAELREVQRPRGDAIAPVGAAGVDVLRHVGSVRSDRRSSFVRFEPDKPPGVLRVCAFGDSLTYGDEVRRDRDFPTQLERLFDRAGARNVEVINFGNSWHGFHQIFLIWELVGRRFDCDFVLLGPAGFWPDRDTSFNHTELHSPYFLHSRYVLDGDDLRLVGVIGADHRERFEAYFRFLPHWRYLRYDRNPPAALRALIPRGRTLPNPLYYHRGSSEEEAARTWRILLRRMAADGRQLLLSNVDAGVVALARELALPNLAAMDAVDEVRFPYRMPRGHYSAWGNALVARQFFAQLVADAERAAQLLETRDAETPSAASGPRRPLHSYRRVAVELAGTRVGRLVTASASPWERGLGRRSGFGGPDVVSVLAIAAGGASLLDACLLPLAFELRPGAVLSVRRAGGGGERRLGTVRLPDPRLALGVVAVGALEFRRKQELVARAHGGLDARDAPFELMLDARPVMRGVRRGDEVVFAPSGRRVRQFVARRIAAFELAALPPEGLLHLVLEHPEDGALRVPLARWRRVRTPLPGPAVPPARQIEISPDGVASVKESADARGGRSSF